MTTVSMRWLERFPVTEIAGIAPINAFAGWGLETEENVGRSLIVRLRIGKERLEALLKKIEEKNDDNGSDADAEYEIDSQATISPPPSTNDRTTTTRNTNPTGRTNSAATSITTYTGTDPIPADILAAANAIHAVKKNKDGLPQKTILWEMDGFVASKGRLKKTNPLREWVGDDRLFSGLEWGWLMGEK
ncbi:hypothetical protein PRZ48_011458 [Zasmidium cellare]|uniref:Uncharacterized protein n=1 Tax=Zasmidium cellare TaxID=395010 RepID=A0ABR0E6R0_ZASCE|nr:hypothetical protein PRZ48_011458 [Zasmidium cellare]